ncbi:MAG TPA: YicC/YloC family endoribonuclease [Hyphomicrobiales bacterium]|nr:YicC/YloC family endoribonuclease [Hyphomicrobiales bacterium]
MAVKSMTGFGRASGQTEEANWTWEIRTVNGRGLDIRMRLPTGFEEFEARLKDLIGKRIARGSCSVSLTLKGAVVDTDIQLNESALLKLAGIAERAREVTGHDEKVPLASLLAMKGVIESVEPAPGERIPSSLLAQLSDSFSQALDELVAARIAEGARLRTILLDKLQEIETGTRQAETSPERRPEAIAGKLGQQIQRLLAENQNFDEARLYQEAVLIATKADIEEELKRLHAHVAAARDLLEEDVPVGRRLEFMAQEFQREANTLCSKSNASEITRIGLNLKTAIDQLREQVQNVE